MDIPLGQLAAHPANPNRMSEETFEKLKGHIRRTGRYEAVVVRPMKNAECGMRDAESAPQYQILNGHHRVEALRQLGHATARCDVWDVDDTEALVLVATLNRLCGEDEPERRDALLRDLLARIEAPRLADLVPESSVELEDLARLLGEVQVPDLAPPDELEQVEFLFFAVTAEQRYVIETALRTTGVEDRAEALVALARAYTS